MNIKETQLRFSEASWFKAPKERIIIGGAGTISSWLSLFLSRIGYPLYIYDDDTVEEVNMAGQFYKINDTNSFKVTALVDNIRDFADQRPFYEANKYTCDSDITNIMISGFDNMAARKVFFENWYANPNRELLIDGRLTAEDGQIFAVTKGMEEEYKKFLFSDEEVIDLPCSFKSTTHSGALIASLMTSILNNYISNTFLEEDLREVPFFTSFNLAMLHFNTENYEFTY